MDVGVVLRAVPVVGASLGEPAGLLAVPGAVPMVGSSLGEPAGLLAVPGAGTSIVALECLANDGLRGHCFGGCHWQCQRQFRLQQRKLEVNFFIPWGGLEGKPLGAPLPASWERLLRAWVCRQWLSRYDKNHLRYPILVNRRGLTWGMQGGSREGKVVYPCLLPTTYSRLSTGAGVLSAAQLLEGSSVVQVDFWRRPRGEQSTGFC